MTVPARTLKVTGAWEDDDGVAAYTITLAMLKAVAELRVDTKVDGWRLGEAHRGTH
ncbi:MAG: hypothetical protein OXR82_10170 [Gammaproteobacteria bacterium]|nr:hypothetical protein [Gammaproteobacteria bacterium]MDE0258734.1 hypothetical protein [Gammaproteobacteria bacterium]